MSGGLYYDQGGEQYENAKDTSHLHSDL